MNLAFLFVPMIGGLIAFVTRYIDGNRHHHPKKHSNVSAPARPATQVNNAVVTNSAMEHHHS